MADDQYPNVAGGQPDPVEQAIAQQMNKNFATAQGLQTEDSPTGGLQGPGPVAQIPGNVYQPPSGPPKMGGTPAIVQYIANMLHGGPKGLQPVGTPQPSRADMSLDFLGNFLSNLSQGLAQAGHGPGANLRGFAGAVQAPYQRSLQDWQVQQAAQKQQADVEAEQARTGLTQAQTEQMGQMVTLPNGMTVPFALAQKIAPSLFSGQARVEAAGVSGQARVTAAQIQQGMPVDVPKELQDKFGAPAKLPLAQLNKLESAANRPLTTVQGATDSYLVNRQTLQKTALGVGSPRIAAIQAQGREVADPDNPGQTKWVTLRDALNKGMAGPASASLQVPRAVMKWATTGKGGEEINAFNTALQHADLLEQALVAMHNGDNRTLQGLSNKFKTEFGSSDVTNYQAIANAYTREISKMLASGHMTNDEINTNAATLPANASPEQIRGVLDSYRALATSKMNMRYEQYQQGLKAKPNFPQTRGSVTAEDMLKKYPVPR